MSAGKLKRSKNVLTKIGQTLENLGNSYNQFWGAKPIQDLAGAVGKGVGMAIPIVGGTLGKTIAKSGAELKADLGNLTSKVGQAIQGKYGWKDIGNDIINYVPNKIKESVPYKVITGQTTIPDAIINALEDSAYINYLAPYTKLFGGNGVAKTHAWKDNQGNYHQTYQPGSKLVVGEWQNNKGPQLTPLSDNGRVTGITSNGEVIRN